MLVSEQVVPRRFQTPVAGSVRALHVINGDDYSGAERVQDLLALRLAERDITVGFACVKPGRFADVRRSQQAPLANFPMRCKADLSPIPKLKRFIQRDGYDLVHAYSPRAVLIARPAAALAGVPLVYHVQSPAAADSASKYRNFMNMRVERICVRGAAAVIACSHSMVPVMRRQGIPSERIHVIPNGVAPRGPLLDRPTPCGVWRIGMLALFRPRKGLHVLLDALAQLRHQGARFHFRAVGAFQSPAYEATIQRQVAKRSLQDLVEFVGFQSDVDRELAELDLFVLPSLYGEGLPLALLEAMAAGTPAISTAVEGIPEVLRDGIDGVVAPPGDAPALAAAIARVMRGDLDWTALRQQAHRRQSERFSDASMAAGVEEVYRSVLFSAAP